MVRVLFVCTANICRSPTAAALLHCRAAAADLAVEADSAATHPFRLGEGPDPRTIEVAAAHDVDVSQARARLLTPNDFDRFDLVVAMERKHARHLLKLCPEGREAKVRLLMSFVPDSTILDIPDPYLGDVSFEEAFVMIEQGIVHLLDHLQETLLQE